MLGSSAGPKVLLSLPGSIKVSLEVLTPLAILCICVALALFSGILRFQYPLGTSTPFLDAMFLASAACAIVCLMWTLSRWAKAWADRETERAEESTGGE